ncbi:DUF1661 domain-containing protein [Porphyromonas gulae]|uniref:DUF1661 domain-containing protein n=1 Tax=Porphyromonas gulae TaxID=111105 RepID=UPI0034E977B0
MWSDFFFVLVRELKNLRAKTKTISRRILKFVEPQSCHIRFEKNLSYSSVSYSFKPNERL